MLPYKLNKYKDWWNGIAVREQRLLIIGGFLLFIVTIYLVMWGPLFNAAESMRTRIRNSEQTLLAMQTLNEEINALTSRNQQASNNKNHSPVEVISLLQNQISKTGIKDQLTQLKQGNKDAIEMHFQKVEFDQLCTLFIQLNKTKSVKIVQIAVKNDPSIGHVSADVTVGL